MLQDIVGAVIILLVIWFVLRLAFGETSHATGAGQAGHAGAGTGPSKESTASKAWRDARAERERTLRQRKQELMEAARRQYLEKGIQSSKAGPSSSSSAAQS